MSALGLFGASLCPSPPVFEASWGRKLFGVFHTVLTLDPGDGGRWRMTAPYQSPRARCWPGSHSVPSVGWAPQGQGRLQGQPSRGVCQRETVTTPQNLANPEGKAARSVLGPPLAWRTLRLGAAL